MVKKEGQHELKVYTHLKGMCCPWMQEKEDYLLSHVSSQE